MTVCNLGSSPSPFGYAGGYGYQEDATGLKLLGHRYYDPSTGRFLTRDPIRDGKNWFTYCSNNPLKWVDPEGLDWIGIQVDPGGPGNAVGAHARIGIADGNSNYVTWWGFYPDGIRMFDNPAPGSKVYWFYVDAKKRRKVKRAILLQYVRQLGGKRIPYSLTGRNCATWIASLLSLIYDEPFDDIKTPNQLKGWAEAACGQEKTWGSKPTTKAGSPRKLL